MTTQKRTGMLKTILQLQLMLRIVNAVPRGMRRELNDRDNVLSIFSEPPSITISSPTLTAYMNVAALAMRPSITSEALPVCCFTCETICPDFEPRPINTSPLLLFSTGSDSSTAASSTTEMTELVTTIKSSSTYSSLMPFHSNPTSTRFTAMTVDSTSQFTDSTSSYDFWSMWSILTETLGTEGPGDMATTETPFQNSTATSLQSMITSIWANSTQTIQLTTTKYVTVPRIATLTDEHRSTVVAEDSTLAATTVAGRPSSGDVSLPVHTISTPCTAGGSKKPLPIAVSTLTDGVNLSSLIQISPTTPAFATGSSSVGPVSSLSNSPLNIIWDTWSNIEPSILTVLTLPFDFTTVTISIPSEMPAIPTLGTSVNPEATSSSEPPSNSPISIPTPTDRLLILPLPIPMSAPILTPSVTLVTITLPPLNLSSTGLETYTASIVSTECTTDSIYGSYDSQSSTYITFATPLPESICIVQACNDEECFFSQTTGPTGQSLTIFTTTTDSESAIDVTTTVQATGTDLVTVTVSEPDDTAAASTTVSSFRISTVSPSSSTFQTIAPGYGAPTDSPAHTQVSASGPVQASSLVSLTITGSDTLTSTQNSTMTVTLPPLPTAGSSILSKATMINGSSTNSMEAELSTLTLTLTLTKNRPGQTTVSAVGVMMPTTLSTSYLHGGWGVWRDIRGL